MKFIPTIMLCSLMVPTLAQAAVINKTNPYVMMEQVAEQTFSTLKAQQSTIQRNPQQLRAIVKQELLPYINARYAAYKVLGPQLKKTTKAQRDAFVTAFTEYLVSSYAQVLTQYTDQKIKVEGVKPIPTGRSIVSVRVDILDNKRPAIRLDFKLRKNNKTQQWQGFDMVAEGISLISTKQSEWSGLLRTEGVDAVTQRLKVLANKPIVIEKKR